jgi:hypothetical protein
MHRGVIESRDDVVRRSTTAVASAGSSSRDDVVRPLLDDGCCERRLIEPVMPGGEPGVELRVAVRQ